VTNVDFFDACVFDPILMIILIFWRIFETYIGTTTVCFLWVNLCQKNKQTNKKKIFYCIVFWKKKQVLSL